MKIAYLSRPWCASLAVVLVTFAGCGGSEEKTATEAAVSAEASAGAEALVGADALVEEHDGGSVAWNVGAGGNVKAAVSGPDRKVMRENVEGALEWKADGETKTAPLTLDAKTGLLVAAGPKLEADLTELRYSIKAEGKPWSGTLHLPVGGTAALVAGAKASAEISVPEGKVGPHGGVIQVVGKDRLELVADELSGEVRVYLLDADFNAVAVGDRSITLGVVADAPQVVVLSAAEAGAYFSGKWSLGADPLKVTIALRNAGQTAVALVGFRAGARIAVGASAPRLKVRMKTKWEAHGDLDPDIDLKAKIKADADAKAKVRAGVDADLPDIPKVHGNAGAGVKVDVKGPSVKVKTKVEAPKISVKPKAAVKAGAGVKLKAGF